MASLDFKHGLGLRSRVAGDTIAHSAAVSPRYVLAVPRDARRALAVGWLALGLIALVAAGVLSILLVASRTPGLQSIFATVDFFRVALVAHVDLSVLVWFLAFAGVLWTINGTPRALHVGWLAFALAAGGTAAIAFSPFFGQGRPVMANYIPVLRDPWFLTGLVTFTAGITLLVLRGMATAPAVGIRLDGAGALRFGLNTSLVSAAVALIAFAWSWRVVPTALDPAGYYELLFWGGGHVLQFTWALLMLVAWLMLADGIGARVPLSPRVVTLLFVIGLAAAFITPVIYLAYDVGSVEHHRLLTWLMQFGGGLAIPPIALAVLWGCLRRRGVGSDQRPLRAALVTSIALFGIGGLIGFFIHGSNVRIPAHYHGCIVGVTVALMGLAYMLLPTLGFARPAARLATIQPYLYGGGQLLHVIGLVWSGGYGVQRKVAGAEQALRTTQEIAGMGLMGLGGLIAIVGGMLFVFVVLQALWRSRAAATPIRLAGR
jgi:cytochrome c oxidase subunit I